MTETPAKTRDRKKTLFALTASDLMTPAVVTLPEEMLLPAAARLLHRLQVSGAPVVDHQGRCTGVLSATDFMHRAEADVAGGRESRDDDAFNTGWQVIEVEALPHDEVRDHMTAGPVTVSPDRRFVRMAEMMMEAQIHRLIVVDAESHPIGVVTTTDILAALVREGKTIP
jgi:CBS-domain-containing membrane protein